jgi:hypothetical protein
MALSSVVASVGVAGLVFAPASHAATSVQNPVLGVPKLSESCNIPAFASAHYLIKDGHAMSGTWTLAPRITCDQPKTALTIGTTLKRDGRVQFWSSGRCQARGTHLCKQAVGPTRSKSYTTNIRGSWSASVAYTVAGPDAVLFSRSSPNAGKCSFNAKTFTASCHYDTAPVVIR